MNHVRINTSIYATEDPDRVMVALHNMFTFNDADVVKENRSETVALKLDVSVRFEVEVIRVVLELDDTACLAKLKVKLNENSIEECARSILYQSRSHVEGNTIRLSFKLHKQAAFMGLVHFSEMHESPLGPINVDITTDDVDGFINWLAPRVIVVKKETAKD